MAFVCPEKMIKIAGLSSPLKAEPEAEIVENLKKIEQAWCIKTLMMPAHDGAAQKANAKQAQQALEAINVLQEKFSKVVSDPEQLEKMKNPVFRQRLQKVADRTFYKMAEVERANLIDTKAILETKTLDQEARKRRREELKPKPFLAPPFKPVEAVPPRMTAKPDFGASMSLSDLGKMRPADLNMEKLFMILILLVILIFASWFPPTRFLTSVSVRFGMIGFHGFKMTENAHERIHSLITKYMFYTLVGVIGAERIFEPLLLNISSDWYMVSIYLYLAAVGYAHFKPDRTIQFLERCMKPVQEYVTTKSQELLAFQSKVLHGKL